MQKYTDEQALNKLQAYCAYQERCPQEVREKLRNWGFPKKNAEALLHQLVEDSFIDESRYATAFVGGKFRLKHWGRIKIKQALSLKGIKHELIEEALEKQIGEEAYLESLRDVISRKAASLPDDLPRPERRHKLAAYAIGAGYEPHLVWELV